MCKSGIRYKQDLESVYVAQIYQGEDLSKGQGPSADMDKTEGQ